MENIDIGNELLQCMDKFCYSRDMIGAGGGAEASPAARTSSAWKRIKQMKDYEVES